MTINIVTRGVLAADRRRSVVVRGLLVLSVLGLFAVVIFLPSAIVQLDTAGRALTANEYVSAVTNSRTSVLQAMGGVAVAIGAIAAWQRLKLNAQEIRAVRDGQLTDRFIRAAEMLGNVSIEIRIGAVFALGRVAANSVEDRDAVIATLSSFVRRNSGWPPDSGGEFPADMPADEVWSLGARSPDVQAALATLGQIPHSLDNERIRLQNTDLRAARIWEYSLDFALLVDANLRNARAWKVSLLGADLSRCDLRDAELRDADLRYACLVGTDLRGAEIDGALLDGSEADITTRWPTDDFDWQVRGVIDIGVGDWRSRPPQSRLQQLRSRMRGTVHLQHQSSQETARPHSEP